jgi:glutathione S-transferase
MVAADEITVFHAVPTRSCRVVWLLEELALKYKTIPVDFPNELFTPEFLKVNPMGTCAPHHE